MSDYKRISLVCLALAILVLVFLFEVEYGTLLHRIEKIETMMEVQK